jgi:hypothetical protein
MDQIQRVTVRALDFFVAWGIQFVPESATKLKDK